MDAKTSTHPEAICVMCRGTNPVWTAPSPLWNEVIRGGDINGREMYDGIVLYVCPECGRAATVASWNKRPICVHTDETNGVPEIWNGDQATAEGLPIEQSRNEEWRSPGPKTWTEMRLASNQETKETE